MKNKEQKSAGGEKALPAFLKINEYLVIIHKFLLVTRWLQKCRFFQ